MGFFACVPGTGATATRPHVEWEEPRCLLCGSDRSSILLEAPDPLPGDGGLWFAVSQCQDCGLCYTNPRPREQNIGQFYPDHYAPHLKTVRPKARTWWRRLRWWGKARQEPSAASSARGRLLDFGCGSGAFLHRMHQRGWQVLGLDMSEHAVQRVRSERGLSAVVGSLPHPELADGSFDLITMRHSLEHVHRPLEVLRAAHRLLAVGGQLIVSTPNIDSLPFKWFGRYWRGLDLPRHLAHFTPDTLQLILARAGFEVGPVRMVRHTEWVRRSAELASKRPDVPLWQRCLRRRWLASLAMWYAYFARRCDGIVVTAVKTDRAPLEPVPTFTQRAPDSPRSPGGRWRNR